MRPASVLWLQCSLQVCAIGFQFDVGRLAAERDENAAGWSAFPASVKYSWPCLLSCIRLLIVQVADRNLQQFELILGANIELVQVPAVR